MPTTRNPLNVMVYAPVLMENDGRPLSMVRGLERAFPGLWLEWTVSDEMQLVRLPHRDAWLAQAIRHGGFPLVCNNDEETPLMISGVALPAALGPGGHALLDVHAELPLNAVGIAVAADALEAVAEGARAFWGHATPFDTNAAIAQQTIHPYRSGIPPRGLPALKLPGDIRSPEIPARLGWLNYWSAAAARAIGFPDPVRDAELLSRARRTASDGWIVQLTDAPLDLDNPAHLDALKRAYERFPRMGGRVA